VNWVTSSREAQEDGGELADRREERERVPERVVHANGSGAHGFFEVTARR
jgi:hypothetical protein